MDITVYALLKNLISKSSVGFTKALEKKLDKNQGTSNFGKIMVVDKDGNLIPQMFDTSTLHDITYNDKTNCIEIKR